MSHRQWLIATNYKREKAAAIAVLIFELEEEIRTNGTWNIGADFFTKFISANLGSLVSQGLLNGDHKIR